MSDELDWNFVDKDDAKAEIRAAVGYLLRDATGSARADVLREIIEIVRQVADRAASRKAGSLGRWSARRLKCPLAGWPLHDSGKAAGAGPVCGLMVAGRSRPPQGAPGVESALGHQCGLETPHTGQSEFDRPVPPQLGQGPASPIASV